MKRVTKEKLLEQIRADRAHFDQIVGHVPRTRMTEPILPGGWSVKDVLAHVAWGEREGIGVMRERALVGSELWELPEDERNAAVVGASRSRNLEEILSEYAVVFDEYLSAISQLSEETLNEPTFIRGLAERIPGWRPWRVVYDPGHYGEHGRAIEDALASDPPPTKAT
jgi:DinB family protein